MKILYSKHFPPQGFGAINILGIIVVRKDYGELSNADRNHELIHTRQMKELLYILFYLCYVIEWCIRLVQYRNRFEAYKNISFEREAYSCMFDIHYLKKRKLFAFMNYYRIK